MNLVPISQAQKKLLRKLAYKKYRQKEGLFIVAGQKSVFEVQKSKYRIKALFLTPNLFQSLAELRSWHIPLYQVTCDELSQLSSLTHHEDLLALVECQPNLPVPYRLPNRYLILDDVQQPHNLGALLRVSDWYGMHHIVASPESVDVYNPKTLQASIGSFTRVSVHYTSLLAHLENLERPILGATLAGESIRYLEFPSIAALVIGNESRGIRPAIYPYLSHQITIPRYGQAESLNLAVAAGILCEAWSHNALS